MANSPQARKRARQADKRAVHNNALRSAMRTSIKKVRALIATGTKEQATEAYLRAKCSIDRMSTKKIIASNQAARYKSRLNAAIKKMA